jgi:hypothetical protein
MTDALTAALMAVLIPLGWALAYLYGFWLLYVLIMGFYRAYLAKRLTKPALVLAAPAIGFGLVVDWFANWTLAALYFQELPLRPRELVTDRLTRYINQPQTTWRQSHANWICTNLLDYFDPNDVHCLKNKQAVINPD